MTGKEQEVFTRCVAEGVKRALMSLKLVEEFPNPTHPKEIMRKGYRGRFVETEKSEEK